ncbi:MAG: hypothetical protein CMI16_01210 [Opitutaceae bacterium]|nr:hypothetical protein [Opitutaceae bacterium]
MKIVLTPLDFSNVSDSVLKGAINLARAIEGRLVLFHVIQPPVITSEYGAVLSNVREIVAVNEQTSLKELKRHQKKLEATGLKVSIAQATGGPVAHILEQAKKSRASYIVMGSHGHTALYDLLAGSTATGVIKRAPCPVVIMPPVKKKKKKSKK